MRIETVTVTWQSWGLGFERSTSYYAGWMLPSFTLRIGPVTWRGWLK